MGKTGSKGTVSRKPSADRHVPPDYSRLRNCEATEEELAIFGAADVLDLVRILNEVFVQAGQFPVTQADYPSTRKRLEKLLKRGTIISPSSFVRAA